MSTDQGLRRTPATQPITWPDADQTAMASQAQASPAHARVVIVDHGFANTLAVDRMLHRTRIRATISDSPDSLLQATHIILPGVGHFDVVQKRLMNTGMAAALHEARSRGSAFLGICLGMQLMFQGSDEGDAEGLGWIEGRCQRLTPSVESRARVPQMGWNRVERVGDTGLLGDQDKFYFLHSYTAVPRQSHSVIGRCRYGGGTVVAAVSDGDRCFGVQFHPEKSHRFGCELLARFVRMNHGLAQNTREAG